MIKTLHQPNDVVGDRYRIVTLLGSGSSGSTYEAENLTTYQRVALKVVSLLQATDWKTLELFEREARVLSNLNHPAIPDYIDYFQLDSAGDRRFYLVQELATGDSLESLIDRGWRSDEEEAKQLATELLQVLNYLHELLPPVIHRDIKPANIIRRPDGRIYLVDFGAVRDVYRNTMTMGMTMVGTMGYMPPEQYQGRIRPASDLYSLGVTLLEAMTGRSPDQFPQTRLKLKFRAYVTLTPQFTDWLECLLEPVLEDRFQSATEALTALENLDRPHVSTTTSVETPSESTHTFQGWLNQLQETPKLLSIPIPSTWTPSNGYISKPSRSPIVIHRQSDRLSIEIPPSIHQPQGIFMIIFFAIWGGIPTLGVVGGILSHLFDFLSGDPSALLSFFGSLLFLLNPFTLVAFCFISYFLTGRIYVDITPTKFYLRFRIWDWFYRRIDGNTSDISRVEIDMQRGSKGKRMYNCVIWEGVKRHRFGSELSHPERIWIVEELALFLLRQRSPRQYDSFFPSD